MFGTFGLYHTKANAVRADEIEVVEQAGNIALRMGGTITELDSSHVPMLSNPKLVLDVIRKAAQAVQKPAATQSL